MIYKNVWCDLKRGVSNLYRWFPTVWKDRDWDNSSIYDILKFKLEKMEKAFRSKNAMSVGANKSADKMRVCSLLLDRLTREEYTAFVRHDKKWGEAEMKFEGNMLNIERPNVITEEDEIQEWKEFRRCINHEELLINQDLEYLFKLMKKHIRTWWD